jgi:hypothetical protein
VFGGAGLSSSAPYRAEQHFFDHVGHGCHH